MKEIKITRKWCMPSKLTFTIKPIKELIDKYIHKNTLDLFPINLFIRILFPYPYKQDVLITLAEHKDNSIDVALFDPPYSPRQLKECYEERGEVLHDTKSSVWSNWKDETARVIKPGGLCLSFGWSSNGLGKKRGFQIVEILLVAHGGNHNDTICVVERKVQKTLI